MNITTPTIYFHALSRKDGRACLVAGPIAPISVTRLGHSTRSHIGYISRLLREVEHVVHVQRPDVVRPSLSHA